MCDDDKPRSKFTQYKVLQNHSLLDGLASHTTEVAKTKMTMCGTKPSTRESLLLSDFLLGSVVMNKDIKELRSVHAGRGCALIQWNKGHSESKDTSL